MKGGRGNGGEQVITEGARMIEAPSSDTINGWMAVIGTFFGAMLLVAFAVLKRVEAMIRKIGGELMALHDSNVEAHPLLRLNLRSEVRYEVADKVTKHADDPHAHPNAFDRFAQNLDAIRDEMREDRKAFTEQFASFQKGVIEPLVRVLGDRACPIDFDDTTNRRRP
jgi:hypothetical protein